MPNPLEALENDPHREEDEVEVETWDEEDELEPESELTEEVARSSPVPGAPYFPEEEEEVANHPHRFYVDERDVPPPLPRQEVGEDDVREQMERQRGMKESPSEWTGGQIALLAFLCVIMGGLLAGILLTSSCDGSDTSSKENVASTKVADESRTGPVTYREKLGVPKTKNWKIPEPQVWVIEDFNIFDEDAHIHEGERGWVQITVDFVHIVTGEKLRIEQRTRNTENVELAMKVLGNGRPYFLDLTEHARLKGSYRKGGREYPFLQTWFMFEEQDVCPVENVQVRPQRHEESGSSGDLDAVVPAD